MPASLPPLIQQYKADSESVNDTWFINNEKRLKAFCSITTSRVPRWNSCSASSASRSRYSRVMCIADIYEHEENKRAFSTKKYSATYPRTYALLCKADQFLSPWLSYVLCCLALSELGEFYFERQEVAPVNRAFFTVAFGIHLLLFHLCGEERL